MTLFISLLLAAQVATSPGEGVGAYFDEGPFQPAQGLIKRGAYEQAVGVLRGLLRAHPDAAQGPQARYLLGLALIHIERYDEAARLFDELAVSYPVLRDEHLFQQGRALYLWGNHLDAARVFAQVDPKGPQGTEARRLRAHALAKATDFERLSRWLAEQDELRRLEPELRLLYAEAQHRTGDVLGAYRGYRQVWQEAEDGSLAASALVAMAGLSFAERSLLPADERVVVLASAKALEAGPARLEEVMARLEDQLSRRAPKGRLRAEVAFARGRLAAKARRFRTALSHYVRSESTARADAVELRARVALERARTLEWLGQAQAALAIYEQVASRFSERPEAEDALFRASELQLRSRRYPQARARCEALLLDNPVSSYRRRCLWSIGWGHYRLGDYTRAREFFDALSKMEMSADLYAASRYWLARTDVQLGRGPEARAGFLAVLQRQPLGYYAALADAQLVQERAPEEGAGQAEPGPPQALPARLVQAREYARLGLAAQALSAARTYERIEKRRARGIPRVGFVELANLYEELGQRREARRVRQEGALEHPASLGSEAFLLAARRSMPMEFEEEIRAAARAHDLPDALLFALVRTESGFRANAVSGMKAYGLAQLILPTARQVARRIGAGHVSVSRLLRDPALNTRLGAAYLRELLDQYEGSEPLALAAYNAGPNAVNAWMSRRLRNIAHVQGRGLGVLPTADELAEEIPVAETRAFVKAVLARKRGYSILYSPSHQEVDAPMVWEGLRALTEPSALPSAPDPYAELPRHLILSDRLFTSGPLDGKKSAHGRP